MKRVPASGMEWVMRTGPGSGAGSESTLVTASVTVSGLALATVTVMGSAMALGSEKATGLASE